MQGDFADATHIVSTNAERGELSRLLGERFAERRKQALFRWRIEMPSWITTHGPTSTHVWSMLDHREDLHGFFTRGACAFLSTNISTKMKMCNGSPCVMESFGYFTHAKKKEFMACVIKQSESRVIDIPYPDFIIVSVSGKRVPILSTDAVEFRISGFKQKIVAKKQGVDIGFAITSWKAQGRTLPKVVLHMNAASLNISSLHVGMTRVEDHANMRLFPVDDWRRILKLNWDPLLREFMTTSTKRKR